MLNRNQLLCDPENQRAEMSKFLKNTNATIARFQEIKTYPRKLLSLRNKLRDLNRKAVFQMYTSLAVTFTHPMTGNEMIGVIKELNDTDLILITPQLNYSIMFENCPTGLECFHRMQKDGFFLEPKKPLFPVDYTHGGVAL